MKNDFLQ